MESTLSVPDITCGRCVRTITSVLEQLEGINSIDVKIGEQRVILDYDQAEDLEAAVRVMASKGYASVNVPAAERTPVGSGPRTAIDPVCGMTVNVDAPYTLSRGGLDYFFCSSGCHQDFESANPPDAIASTSACCSSS